MEEIDEQDVDCPTPVMLADLVVDQVASIQLRLFSGDTTDPKWTREK